MGERQAKRARQDAEEIATLKSRCAALSGQVRELELEVSRERLTRVSAQMGLVNYMTGAGLGHRIGYDPRQDPAVLKEVAEGKLPPLDEFPLRTYRAMA